MLRFSQVARPSVIIIPANDGGSEALVGIMERQHLPTDLQFSECFVELTIDLFCLMMCVPKSNGRMK
ncbi:hypothetical protein ALO83_103387 [Pseudomonas cannabina pv. alisalensis]|uniref:Uncharacterized protein n=1 Tax=Pseudomonas cannabina TaxID=86840 RepID=A0AB37QDY2_PSECA|nr:hypothetical protein [Pseudomonas cannabina]KPW15366.1 hypothetical protein ALO83_103387 [Pseudomonas cannabina pv. alisalensis]RMN83678.1 hypothetical protein ALQ53_103176 [Pseudomonas cannabina]